MSNARAILAILSLFPVVAAGTLAAADGPPQWAFLAPDPAIQPDKDDGTLKHVPGSTKAFTQTQIDDPFSPPDWYADEHPSIPEVVMHGRRPAVRACGQCHLANGFGHPESAGLAGLPAAYIVQQMADYKSGVRKASGGAGGIMLAIAGAATDAEVQAAADYFASVKRSPWVRVVEATSVPKTYVGTTFMRFALKGAGSEPLGQRIIELPEDAERAEARDSHSGFVAYVPVGSIKKGEALVTTGGAKVVAGKIVAGRTIQCGICHGPDLEGPRRSPWTRRPFANLHRPPAL